MGGGGGLKEKFGQPGERLKKPRWDLEKLAPFKKNFYREHPDVTARSLVSFLFSFFPPSLVKLLVISI